MITIHYNKYAVLLLITVCLVRKYITLPWKKLFHFRKTILIMKYDGLGDLIIWIPYADIIRTHYPAKDYHISICCLEQNHKFIKQLGIVDSIICFPCYKNKWQWLLLRTLFYCRYHFDIVINAAYPKDIFLPYRPQKSCTLYLEHWNTAFQKDNNFEKLIQMKDMTIYERYDAILQYLKLPLPSVRNNFNISIQHFPLDTKDYIVICTGASDTKRCWEEEKFAELINLLISTTGKMAVLVGMKSEYAKNERIKSICKHHSKIINLAGKTSIMELFSVIKNGIFLVSNDTGTAHVAGVVKTLSFVICGGQDYGAYFPYPSEVEGKRIFSIFCKDQRCFQCRCTNSECNMRTPYPCISAISVEQVFSTISEVLKISEQKALL